MEGEHVSREQRRLLTDAPDRCTEPTVTAADGRDEGIAIGDRRVGAPTVGRIMAPSSSSITVGAPGATLASAIVWGSSSRSKL